MISTEFEEKKYASLIGKFKSIRTEKDVLTGVDSIVAENATSKVFVPYTFALIVFLHLLKNFMAGFNSVTELILAVAGPFGVGKSVIVEEICRRLGIRTSRLSVADFCSQWEGEPVRMVKSKYYNASKSKNPEEEKIPCCIIVDDIDMSVGNHGSSTTSNFHLVINALMEIADHPTLVEGEPTKRVPIIVTGNDLSKLYGALTRPGRTRSWTYNPTEAETIEIGQHIIGNVLTNEQKDCLKNIAKTWKPSHFGQLKSIIHEIALEKNCGLLTAKDYIYSAFNNDPVISKLRNIRVTDEIFLEAIERIENSREATHTSYIEC